MKLSDLLEAKDLKTITRDRWTIPEISKLKTKDLAALIKNTANDPEMVDRIRQVAKLKQEKASAIAKKHKAEITKSKEPSYWLSKTDLEKISRRIQDVLGQTFPDGDPIDHLAPWLIKNYSIEDYNVGKVLDKAAKLIHVSGKPYKDYYDYLARTWDAFAEDMPEFEKLKNPWK